MLFKLLKPTIFKVIKTPDFNNLIIKEIIFPNILKYSTAIIIAPHGITDMIHAQQNNLSHYLIPINFLSTSFFFILSKFNLSHIGFQIFLIASVFHFQRDFFILKNTLLQFIFSSIVVYCNYISPSIVFFYLLFCHVPNHYIQSWNFLKLNPYKSFFIISIFTFLSINITHFCLNDNSHNSFIENIIKGIIIGHIIYQEKFIHNI